MSMAFRDGRLKKYSKTPWEWQIHVPQSTRKLEAQFAAAMNRGDVEEAERVANILDRFLNPQNVQRKLFKLQLGRVSEAQ